VGVLVICILYSDRHRKRPCYLCSHYVYCTLTKVFLILTEVFLTLTEVFPCFSLSCKANARVKLAKTGHGPHSSTLVVIYVVRLLFVLLYVLFVCKCVLPAGDNPIAVNKYINININKQLERPRRKWKDNVKKNITTKYIFVRSGFIWISFGYSGGVLCIS
jgi:hypothetical protein